jgi:AcrR family transcriptional regulator
VNLPSSRQVTDRRSLILEAALKVLREDGYTSLTQPRVAARAGIRQSHLTYYFPTRASLLVAVAQQAVQAQLALTASALDSASAKVAASRIAKVVSRADRARVLLMLATASDDVPEVRDLFRELAAGMLDQGRSFLHSLDADHATDGADIIYALAVGLAVINFATERPDGEAWAAQTIATALDLLTKGDEA